MLIRAHDGPRRALLPLFARADDSPAMIEGYLERGEVLVAWDGDAAIGHVQLVATDAPGVVEVKSLAVDAARTRAGIGRALVLAAIDHARQLGHRTIVVATATADVDNLRFYQRLGFRFARIERDAFTEAAGYPPDLTSHGIPVRDRIWLDRAIE